MHKKQQHISIMVSSSSSSPCTKLAGAGAKPPRSCDGCANKTARWFCPSDDAFLCQNCDCSVHSANPLARRHQRVRLRCSSPPSSPSWDSGFARKPRTPRNGKRGARGKRPHSLLTEEFSHSSGDAEHALVPEVYSTSDENSRRYEGEEEEELLYRVPIIDPSVAEMCIPGEGKTIPATERLFDHRREKVESYNKERNVNTPSQFATEVERLLLGKGVEKEEEPLVMDMEGLGLLNNFTQETVAANDQNGGVLDGRGNDDFGSENGGWKKKLLLKLNYEGVITAWADQRRPLTNGVERRHLDPNDCWLVHLTPDVMGAPPRRSRDGGVMDEEGRKERVFRYREKRQNRLFSKKIRYQVRKLNADKRPRIKGRFVKRPPPPPLFDSLLPIPH